MSEMQVCEDSFRRKRLLWSSNKDDPDDYYADKLELYVKEDTEFQLRLSVGGTVVVRPTHLWKYI